mmetsp:Transcript_15968/g.39133  ORF Transcript_15968/g.39133 Transcript_15968/m.39133 type:complete len:348 (+) Transcript_15968:77-1120(+)|eukprot:CAMPEP_0113644584 /NCGR_PEP_ID=MMETSP0017_2-20120614/23467_1 /TAXON_ID=2856 /ORGANISM="Cylindrotheca closterium" /LENGTH=347 /DNA_ID=CAMNT_0000556207 /DNA_START=69 /DNA_END=1112 /DNA_ORIENTATION=+ /assembly_acc=CAM_ASM_000147
MARKPKNKNKSKSKKKAKAPVTEDEIAKMKEQVSNRRDQLPEGQNRKSFSFQWKSVPVPKTMETEMTRQVVKRGKYNAISDSGKEAISQYIATSKSAMTLSQAISLRAAVLQEKTMNRHHAVLGRHAKEITDRYQRGQGILSLAKRYDSPPVNLFRTVLSGRGFQKSQIKQCIKNPENHLNERDCQEFQKACREDVVSSPNCEKAHEQAERFETITEQFLKDLGVAFLTQQDLIREQKPRYGKIVASPDFLLLDDVMINGRYVRWIDCKAFYGANVNCRKKGVAKQSARYQEYWGSGAVVFLEGFSEALLGIKDCTCLSARQFMETHYFQPLLEQYASEATAQGNQG